MTDADREAKRRKIAVMGCAWLMLFTLIGLLFAGVEFFWGASDPSATGKAEAQKVEEHRAGLHCVVGGFNTDFIAKVKKQLRDPDSFQHDETRIGPVDATGQHTIAMRFRSRNGFGGMNVQTAVGKVDTGTCEATVTMIG